MNLNSVVNAFNYIPTSEPKSEDNNALSSANRVLGAALAQAPNLLDLLYPTNSSSQMLGASALGADLPSIINEAQRRLNNTLRAVEFNALNFLAFADNGNFSTNSPSLPDGAYWSSPLATYLVTKSLLAENITAVAANNTNVQEVAARPSLAFKINCTAYDAQGLCDGWWYSKKYNSTFGLDNLKKIGQSYANPLSQLLSNYTTGELLFEDAASCHQTGVILEPVYVGTPQGLLAPCLSQIQQLTWDSVCTQPELPTHCEFLEVPRQSGFFAKSSTKVNGKSITQYQVPYSYLGPLIAQTNVTLKRASQD